MGRPLIHPEVFRSFVLLLLAPSQPTELETATWRTSSVPPLLGGP